MTKTATAPADQARDQLLPDPVVAAEFHVSLMSLWRWTRDPALKFPPPVKIRGKNYRSRKLLEQFKERMLRDAIRQRAARDGEAA